MTTPRTVVDHIGVERDGVIAVRLQRQLVNGASVLSFEYHRVNIQPGADVAEQLENVDLNLARLGWPPVPAGDVANIRAHAGAQGTWPAPLDCLGGVAPTPMIETLVESPTWLERKFDFMVRMDAGIPSGSVLVFGDSLIAGMAPNSISPFCVNLGIDGEPMRNLFHRLDMGALRRAAAGVVLTSINDLYNERAAHGPTTAIETINFMWDRFDAWISGRWIICKLLPIDEARAGPVLNAEIAQVNAHIQSKFQGYSGVRLVDAWAELAPAGQLLPAYTLDGLHLSAAGQNILRGRIRSALSSLGL